MNASLAWLWHAVRARKKAILRPFPAPGVVHSEQIDERLFQTQQEQLEWAKNRIPVGYIGDAEDEALFVVYLSSPRARYITGELVYVDGGAKRFSH